MVFEVPGHALGSVGAEELDDGEAVDTYAGFEAAVLIHRQHKHRRAIRQQHLVLVRIRRVHAAVHAEAVEDRVVLEADDEDHIRERIAVDLVELAID